MIPGSGRSSRVGNATHSSVLAWKIPWTEAPGGSQPTGSQKAGHERVTEQACNYVFLLLRWVLVAVCGFFSIVADGDCSLVVTEGFLVAAASLLWSRGSRACRLQ